jgi:hypothetical protein
MQNRETTKKILVWALILLIAAVIIGYALYASHGFIKGPDIIVSTPKETSFSTSTVMISGTAIRAKTLTLNGKVIFVDEKGNFSETLLLSPGYNVETIEAQDKFGRIKKVTLPITYNRQ